jgi:hypothetical protein
VNRRCASCKRVFSATRRDAVYCTQACKVRAWRNGESRPDVADVVELATAATLGAFIENLRQHPEIEQRLRAIMADRAEEQKLRERLLGRGGRYRR